MDPIKEAFSKIKKDIQFLKDEILQLKLQIAKQTDNQTHIQTNTTHIPTQIVKQTDNQTHIQTNTTHILPIESPYHQNSDSSMGNEGVPTNRQTDKQTHQQTHNITHDTNRSEFTQANNILESIDNIKKGIRVKFKRLTPQEMLVFSTLYTLEEQNIIEITYRTLSKQINLSESSIRDYINKLIKKGIPIEKIRQNNKTILLNTSQDLKNIATLATIQTLREI